MFGLNNFRYCPECVFIWFVVGVLVVKCILRVVVVVVTVFIFFVCACKNDSSCEFMFLCHRD